MADIFGWLTPSREFVPVHMGKHIEEIGENPILNKYIPWFDEDMRQFIDFENMSKRAIQEGKHPNWHCYEMAEYALDCKIIYTLYNNGCLRVGSSSDTMYFEGTSASIGNLYQCAKDLAESYNMIAKFEPRRNP